MKRKIVLALFTVAIWASFAVAALAAYNPKRY